jgi:hypothetical protein
MGSLELGVGQAFAAKLGSVEPTGVGLLSSHTGRAKVGESGCIGPGISPEFVHGEDD